MFAGFATTVKAFTVYSGYFSSGRRTINSVTVNFMENTSSWIFAPLKANYEYSDDGINYKEMKEKGGVLSPINNEVRLDYLESFFDNIKARYIRITAKSPKICPEGHPGAGKKCWIFIDEITVN